MIWSIFDNDAHRIVSKKGLNLLQMENKLDKQLAKETPESLTEWMVSKRKTELFYQKQVMNPYPTESQLHTAYEKGFIEGFELGATWGYNKAIENLYTEEDVLAAIEVGFDLGKNFDNDNPNIGLGWLIYQKDNFIKSLKQK